MNKPEQQEQWNRKNPFYEKHCAVNKTEKQKPIGQGIFMIQMADIKKVNQIGKCPEKNTVWMRKESTGKNKEHQYRKIYFSWFV